MFISSGIASFLFSVLFYREFTFIFFTFSFSSSCFLLVCLYHLVLFFFFLLCSFFHSLFSYFFVFSCFIVLFPSRCVLLFPSLVISSLFNSSPLSCLFTFYIFIMSRSLQFLSASPLPSHIFFILLYFPFPLLIFYVSLTVFSSLFLSTLSCSFHHLSVLTYLFPSLFPSPILPFFSSLLYLPLFTASLSL